MKNTNEAVRGYSRAARGGEMEKIKEGGEGVYNADCDSGEVENVKHFLMRCKAWNREREDLME